MDYFSLSISVSPTAEWTSAQPSRKGEEMSGTNRIMEVWLAKSNLPVMACFGHGARMVGRMAIATAATQAS